MCGDSEILNTQREFYEELYTSDPNISFSLNDEVENKIVEESSGADERNFTVAELSTALKSMKNGSCPGGDGIPTEAYKCFWPHIKYELHEALLAGYNRGELWKTARTGVLNLIPKGQKDTRYLKNLRPITLLNTDYKIAEKVIANRMVPCLEEVIHKDQKGFLPDRRIAANIRKILDVMKTTESDESDAIVLSCDFLKCFDRVETECVIKSMSYFGFSTTLQNWVQVVYKNFQVRVQNRGFFSDPISHSKSPSGRACQQSSISCGCRAASNLYPKR